ncbi:MAG: hypothetical protein WCO06_00900 [Candidatus Roizmanbacteria bacterium]
MQQKVFEKIDVITAFYEETGEVMPKKIRWRGREYNIKKLGYYHRYRQGRNIIHIFHVNDGTMDFRLRFDAENLHWILEEITDGNSV